LKKSFFVSDVHLDSLQNPRLTALFLSFLDFVDQQAGDIYILGDLFDYWANNRIIYQKNKSVLERLHQLHRAGNHVGLLWGNRDFLLKPGYLAQFGVKLLPEIHSQKIGGRHVLMTHGHSLCLADRNFLRYRNLWWKVFKLLDPIVPGWIENYIAQKIRQRSRRRVNNMHASEPCLSEESIQQYFDCGVEVVICGHIHRPGIKQYPPDKQLVVLPEWDTTGGYCLLEGGHFSLLNYP
jgi:UDP-2,3-diacylglucosamine hydrolase